MALQKTKHNWDFHLWCRTCCCPHCSGTHHWILLQMQNDGTQSHPTFCPLLWQCQCGPEHHTAKQHLEKMPQNNCHKICKAVTAGIVRIACCQSSQNLADLLTKPGSPQDCCQLLNGFLFTRKIGTPQNPRANFEDQGELQLGNSQDSENSNRTQHVSIMGPSSKKPSWHQKWIQHSWIAPGTRSSSFIHKVHQITNETPSNWNQMATGANPDDWHCLWSSADACCINVACNKDLSTTYFICGCMQLKQMMIPWGRAMSNQGCQD